MLRLDAAPTGCSNTAASDLENGFEPVDDRSKVDAGLQHLNVRKVQGSVFIGSSSVYAPCIGRLEEPSEVVDNPYVCPLACLSAEASQVAPTLRDMLQLHIFDS